MTTSETRQCTHIACQCEVRKDDAHCSEYCRKRVESPLSDQQFACECGHAQCHSETAEDPKR